MEKLHKFSGNNFEQPNSQQNPDRKTIATEGNTEITTTKSTKSLTGLR
jgi:hypothetical protein